MKPHALYNIEVHDATGEVHAYLSADCASDAAAKGLATRELATHDKHASAAVQLVVVVTRRRTPRSAYAFVGAKWRGTRVWSAEVPAFLRESVKVLVERGVWDALPALRAELQTVRFGGKAAQIKWTVQRTAVWAVVELGTVASRGLSRAMQANEGGVAFVEVALSAPQCVGCGCVHALACDDECGWASMDPPTCTSCAAAPAAGGAS